MSYSIRQGIKGPILSTTSCQNRFSASEETEASCCCHKRHKLSVHSFHSVLNKFKLLALKKTTIRKTKKNVAVYQFISATTYTSSAKTSIIQSGRIHLQLERMLLLPIHGTNNANCTCAILVKCRKGGCFQNPYKHAVVCDTIGFPFVVRLRGRLLLPLWFATAVSFSLVRRFVDSTPLRFSSPVS